MLEKQERTAVTLLCGVVLVLVCAHLVLDTSGKTSFASPYSPYLGEGELVILEGFVEDTMTTKNGGHVNLVVNGVRVFVPEGAGWADIPKKGDYITVIGIIQIYKGDREILVQEAGDVRIRE
jgi:hypothetical protein